MTLLEKLWAEVNATPHAVRVAKSFGEDRRERQQEILHLHIKWPDYVMINVAKTATLL
jgi:hypothetical protein